MSSYSWYISLVMCLLELLSKITQTMALPLGIGCHKRRKKIKQSEVRQSFQQGTGSKLSQKNSVFLNNQEHRLISV